jgi:2'-hydroxyisoflavone reductase
MMAHARAPLADRASREKSRPAGSGTPGVMRLLVLGGTIFLGRHVVAEALDRGHDVTLFNRGKHNPGLFAGVEELRGDRDGDLDALRGRRWDVVVDTSGNRPEAVAAAAECLRDAVDRYVFVSTLAAYAGFPRTPGLDETAPLAPPPDPPPPRITPRTAGPLKAECERALAPVFDGRALVVRAGLLAGPHDPTGRFTYWPRRVAQGGEVLAPAGPAVPVQLVDARDVARWIVRGSEEGLTGAFNASGPRQPLTLGELLETCRSEARADAEITWADERFLLESGVQPQMELPLWMPGAAGAAAFDCRRAYAAGLELRPLVETVRDTLAWEAGQPAPSGRAGITREREAELLRAWHERRVPAGAR